MEHDLKIWDTATFLVERYGQNAPEIAQGWSRELTERHESEAAARCLEIVDAAKKISNMIREKIDAYEPMLHDWEKRRREITELETVTHLVPHQEVADRFQRCEGSLERAFDRTLVQLERLQRIRTGHPVPPPLKVELSR